MFYLSFHFTPEDENINFKVIHIIKNGIILNGWMHFLRSTWVYNVNPQILQIDLMRRL